MHGNGHRYIGAKVLMAAAWCIIMLHSVVPHHDHDRCGSGLVFENELDCQCDHHDHDCDHHDGCCKLQDLLSQLVISTKDDKFVLGGQQSAGSCQRAAVSGSWNIMTARRCCLRGRRRRNACEGLLFVAETVSFIHPHTEGFPKRGKAFGMVVSVI